MCNNAVGRLKLCRGAVFVRGVLWSSARTAGGCGIMLVVCHRIARHTVSLRRPHRPGVAINLTGSPFAISMTSIALHRSPLWHAIVVVAWSALPDRLQCRCAGGSCADQVEWIAERAQFSPPHNLFMQCCDISLATQSFRVISSWSRCSAMTRCPYDITSVRGIPLVSVRGKCLPCHYQRGCFLQAHTHPVALCLWPSHGFA